MTDGRLEPAVAAIRAGGVVAIPTDTVYGLACNPADPAAVERVYLLKRRPAGLELTLLAAAVDDLGDAVRFDAVARRLAAAFWPGALSLVLPVGDRRFAIPRVGATLSMRVPDHPLLLELLAMTGPLATTSANRHGEPAATMAAALDAGLRGALAAVLDGGPAGGRASTIIDCTCTPPRVLRHGPISEQELLAVALAPTSPSSGSR